jgi:hypothetical protein
MPTEITVRTAISGIVNGEMMKGNVLASLNTDVGGRSACEFSDLPRGFTPAAFGTFAWTSHHTSAGLSRADDDVKNLYDLTLGNYRVFRAVSYPDYPGSLVVFDAQVIARADSEWATEIAIYGTYTGPTDVITSDEYRLTWVSGSPRLLESGSASLGCSSGERLQQIWSSIITPTGDSQESLARIMAFPAGGQVINATISPFRIDGHRMDYEWQGTVARQEQDPQQTR